jgi:hypothetical protein
MYRKVLNRGIGMKRIRSAQEAHLGGMDMRVSMRRDDGHRMLLMSNPGDVPLTCGERIPCTAGGAYARCPAGTLTNKEQM